MKSLPIHPYSSLKPQHKFGTSPKLLPDVLTPGDCIRFLKKDAQDYEFTDKFRKLKAGQWYRIEYSSGQKIIGQLCHGSISMEDDDGQSENKVYFSFKTKDGKYEYIDNEYSDVLITCASTSG